AGAIALGRRSAHSLRVAGRVEAGIRGSAAIRRGGATDAHAVAVTLERPATVRVHTAGGVDRLIGVDPAPGRAAVVGAGVAVVLEAFVVVPRRSAAAAIALDFLAVPHRLRGDRGPLRRVGETAYAGATAAAGLALGVDPRALAGGGAADALARAIAKL